MNSRVSRLSGSIQDQMADCNGFIFALGYETRARNLAESLRTHIEDQPSLILDYGSIGECAYDVNKSFFLKQKYGSFVPSSNISAAMSAFVDQIRTAIPEQVPTIGVDISSMDRSLLADVVVSLTTLQKMDINIRFAYSFAQYMENQHGSQGDSVEANHPLPGFEGSLENPGGPLHCFLGLGFEWILALGCLEQLEPTFTTLLIPIGIEEEYFNDVISRNRELLSAGSAAGDLPQTLLEYPVNDMFTTIGLLDRAVNSAFEQTNVAIVPLGPKPLALASLLVSVARNHDIAIWRFSAGRQAEPEDRIPEGHIATVSFAWRPTSKD